MSINSPRQGSEKLRQIAEKLARGFSLLAISALVTPAFAVAQTFTSHAADVPILPVVTAPALHFGATKAGSAGPLTAVTPPQVVTVTFGATSDAWFVSVTEPWVQITGGSGFGTGQFTVGVSDPSNFIGASTTLSAFVSVVVPALGAAISVPVTLSVQQTGPGEDPGALPFGSFDTPVTGTTVTGSIAVTGWALDDIGVAGVKIYRNCLLFTDVPTTCQSLNGNSVVFIGDAAFVAGARPDVEAAYATYPAASRAGWGYLMLTNMLPHVTAPENPFRGGQGPLTLFAYATDVEGHRTLLGQKAITLDNDHGAKPFGSIDGPSQGGTVSGVIPNYGWALTPGAAMIPTDGSTMTVVIDGIAVGHVDYNHCRSGMVIPPPGGCGDDVAILFPSTNNILHGVGAIGVLVLDTTKITNGIHTIAWGVTDDQNRADGIGSRFFNVLNGGPNLTQGGPSGQTTTAGSSKGSSLQIALAVPAAALGTAAELAGRSVSDSDIDGRAGFNFDAPLETIHVDDAGVRHVRMPELGRIELRVGSGTTAGYQNANGTLRPLPPGSQINTATGQFTWAPGPGYIGTYNLVFIQGSTQIPVDVTIEPKLTTTVGLMRGWIDVPTPSASVGGAFTVAGWALDSAAWHGAGVGAVHVWAQRRDGVGAGPVFLGSASLGGSRPDVASAFGKQYDRTGWSLSASDLPAGVYEVTAYFWSNRTEQFEDARTVTVSVR